MASLISTIAILSSLAAKIVIFTGKSSGLRKFFTIYQIYLTASFRSYIFAAHYSPALLRRHKKLFIMQNLKQSVADYNAMYSTSFEVSNLCSLSPLGNCYGPDSLNGIMDKGGLFLIYDSEMKLLSVYSSLNIGERMQAVFSAEESGNWVANGTWISEPRYLICVTGDQSRLYEKDSLRSFLIEMLNPMYNARGALRDC